MRVCRKLCYKLRCKKLAIIKEFSDACSVTALLTSGCGRAFLTLCQYRGNASPFRVSCRIVGCMLHCCGALSLCSVWC